MRTLEGSDRIRNGLIGLLVLIMVIGVGQSFVSTPMLFAKPIYYAHFADSAGSGPGDKVRINGVDVGKLKSLKIDGDRVKVGFTLGDQRIGSDSRVSIRTDTILGKRVMEIDPRGNKPLAVNAVRKSLNVLSETLDQSSPELSKALDGIARFSDTIGKRDDEFKLLLAQANKVAGVLGNRSEQINRLLVNAQVLLATVNARGQAIDALLANVAAVSQQFAGFIDDNPNLNNVLSQLEIVSGVLAKHKEDFAYSITTASKFMGALAEGIGSGPYFKSLIVNLIPGQLMQPFVDAAFKKRGIDPEEFWRNAGLPAFRFPDPTAPMQANGAPPAPQPIMEGTPEFPGPAVGPGSPCSYTPTGGSMTPGNPMPCASVTDGPYGPVPGGFPPPNIAVSAPVPDSATPNHGVPAAAIPGTMGPIAPGLPGPALAPGPSGARTVPVPGPVDAPPIAPLDMGGQ
jgi:phospholipid/cholesterol/gamma-HCH transport system substrate-binding protein